MEFLDELWSSVPALGAPHIRLEWELGYAELSAILITGPSVFAIVVEPAVLVWAELRARGPTLVAAVLVLAMCMLLAALAWGPGAMLVAMAGAYVASGVAVGVAQASLMDADPEGRERWMTRWTLVGATGDLVAPLLFAGLSWFGGNWRAPFLACAAALLLLAAAGLWSFKARPLGVPDRQGSDTDAGAPPTRVFTALRAAFRNPALLVWLLGSLLCGLMDELLVVYAGLYMRDHLGYAPAVRSGAFLACSIGAVVGLAATERLLARISPLRLLALSCAMCAAAFVAFLGTSSPAASAAWMFVVGLTAAPHYPIVQARAYRAAPNDSMMVAILNSLLQPAGLAVPILLGLVADHVGLPIALSLLLAQPLCLLLLVAAAYVRLRQL